MKICTQCKQEKDESQFNRWSLSKDRLNSRCRQCTRLYNNNYYNNEGGKEQRVDWYKRGGKEYKKDYALQYFFNITLDQYNEMFIKQQGKCLGCDKKFDKLNVDHDHITKEVRGLLCSNCNFILGHAYDNPEILDRLSDYLKVKT